MVFLKGFINLAITMLMSFLLCNYGENVTSHYSDLSDLIYQMSWLSCPLKVQNSFKLMIMNSQKLIDLEGFARFQCNHDTFKKVFCCIVDCRINCSHISIQMNSNRLWMLLINSSTFFETSNRDPECQQLMKFELCVNEK